MEYSVLIFLHVLLGILWAGGAIAAGFFIIPAVLDAGPAGGAVMAGVVKRRFPLIMTASAILVVLTGLRLFMLRYTPGWLTTPEGLVLSLGGVLGLGALVNGVFVQKPTVERLSALAASVAAGGKPPTEDQARQLEALRTRLRKVALVTAWHLVGASLLMAVHRLAANF